MGQVLHPGLLQGREPVGAETRVHNELVEAGGFSEGNRGDFCKEFLG